MSKLPSTKCSNPSEDRELGPKSWGGQLTFFVPSVDKEKRRSAESDDPSSPVDSLVFEIPSCCRDGCWEWTGSKMVWAREQRLLNGPCNGPGPVTRLGDGDGVVRGDWSREKDDACVKVGWWLGTAAVRLSGRTASEVRGLGVC